MTKEIKKCTMFGGSDGPALNAFATALAYAAARDNKSIYNFLENTPKTSLIVEIYDELKGQGYEIVKKGEVIKYLQPEKIINNEAIIGLGKGGACA